MNDKIPITVNSGIENLFGTYVTLLENVSTLAFILQGLFILLGLHILVKIVEDIFNAK